MFTVDITTNVYVFAAILAASAFAGFILRTTQIARSRARIISLEQEIRTNHAEILELQKDFIALELKMNVVKGPVIKMKHVVNEENQGKLPDVSLRKKLLTKENVQEKDDTFSVVYNNLLGKEANNF
jgi:division protein CdvB (Snf7/Vps24/ESCRT-III family)